MTFFTDAIRNAIPFMIPDEIRATLFRALDRLDAQNEDKLAREEDHRKEQEAHRQELANAEARHRAELEAERIETSKAISDRDKVITERDKVISEQNEEISRLKKALAAKEAEAEDSRNEVRSMNRNKYQGISKRGIDKNHSTDKGRDDKKDDFDGTSGSAAPDDEAEAKTLEGNGNVISKYRCEIEAAGEATRGRYTLADAKETVFYPCDLTLLPEGAEYIGES